MTMIYATMNDGVWSSLDQFWHFYVILSIYYICFLTKWRAEEVGVVRLVKNILLKWLKTSY